MVMSVSVCRLCTFCECEDSSIEGVSRLRCAVICLTKSTLHMRALVRVSKNKANLRKSKILWGNFCCWLCCSFLVNAKRKIHKNEYKFISQLSTTSHLEYRMKFHYRSWIAGAEEIGVLAKHVQYIYYSTVYTMEVCSIRVTLSISFYSVLLWYFVIAIE